MFIELVDQLRCAREHETSWLVASVDRLIGRHIAEGTLGCPVCGTRYPIAGGVTDLRLPEDREARLPTTTPPASGDEATVRLAALLDLVHPGGLVVLAGAWGALAGALARLIDGIDVLAVNASAEELADGVSVVRAATVLPLREGSARGVALDTTHATDFGLERAGAILQAAGRLVAPAGVAVPATCTELARDAAWWVAARTPGLSSPVPLRRAGDAS